MNESINFNMHEVTDGSDAPCLRKDTDTVSVQVMVVMVVVMETAMLKCVEYHDTRCQTLLMTYCRLFFRF